MMSIPRTVTALKRWSCQDKQLPQVNQIQAIHVYDFDNTLFSSPLPNKQLWNAGTCGQLQAQDFLHGGTGGWWHNPNILAATGEGLEKEEGRAWEGSWNEKIVELVQLSMQDTSALSVLLTGRKEDRFAELIGRMLAAKGLEFDMVCLKPSAGPNGEIFQSTMAFKQALLQEIVLTYSAADELRIYEDRPKHTKGFRDFFEDFNRSLMSAGPTARQPFTAEVIQVSEQDSFMDPAVEVAEIQKMINANNQVIRDGTAPMNAIPYKIKRSVFYTGYIIAQPDVDKLRTLVKLPANLPDHELRYLANNIIITPRPAPPSILEKVGGIGAKMRWKVTGIAVLENKLWAVRVQPAIPGTKIYTENHTPCVVLATRRQAKPIEATRIQTWQPIPENQAYEFETTVGEKVLLRIEKEVDNEDTYEASFPNARNARKHPREEDFPPLGSKAGKPSRPQQRQNLQHGNSAWQNKPNGGGFGGGRGGNAGRGGGARGGGQQNFQRRGRGDARGGGRGRGRGGYRSLDDNVGQGYGSGGMQY